METRTIAEIAFDLWAKERGLLNRLGLVAPERHRTATPCWRYAGTTLDLQRREVVHTFSLGSGMREWSFSPWAPKQPDFQPVLELTIHTLRSKAMEAWRSASAPLYAAAADGNILVAGRIGSPLNDLRPITPAAWPFVEVVNWHAATGEGEGIGEIYDLREIEAPEDSKSEDGDDLGRFAAAVKVELAKIYPTGVSANLTDKELHAEVCKHYALIGINRQPSLDTVRRAAGRRKQK